jgi:predicted nucleotidyltransferase component of viral defense system
MQSPANRIECFHLVLLRAMEPRVDRAVWAVKGGVNLRAWFGSLRYSEDMDIDVFGMGASPLRDKVDKVLQSPALRDMLASQGLAVARVSKPKQTDTTQRWKFELTAEGLSLPLHTRVEFSRRGVSEEYRLEPVRPEIVRPYGLLPPTVNHYVARGAVRQKIQALAGRKETQARDVWDLEHLLRTTGVDGSPFSPEERRTVATALERALGLPFDAYQSQVVPYLEPAHQEMHGRPDAWERIRELVMGRLSGYAP